MISVVLIDQVLCLFFNYYYFSAVIFASIFYGLIKYKIGNDFWVTNMKESEFFSTLIFCYCIFFTLEL